MGELAESVSSLRGACSVRCSALYGWGTDVGVLGRYTIGSTGFSRNGAVAQDSAAVPLV